ncbi:MAG: response regulator [Actinomycetes bacterium]
MTAPDGRRRLLVVDDEPDIRTLVTMSLERLGGMQVVPADSGHAALDLLANDPSIDGIILDVQMPGLDGPSTLERVRELPHGATLPVVFLTASVQPSQRRALEQLPVTSLISKPFDPVTLPDLVRSAFGW